MTDPEVVRTLALREALITLRSRAWARLLAWYAFATALAAFAPIFYRTAPYHWASPSGLTWLRAWALIAGIGVAVVVWRWTALRLAREMNSGALDEILLTGSSPADILVGKALATAGMALMLALAALPGSVLAVALGGADLLAVVRLWLGLACLAGFGLCMGMETAFRHTGDAQEATGRFVGHIWSFWWLVGLLAILARWAHLEFLAAWLTWVRRCVRDYNPVSMLLAAPHRPIDWAIGMACTVAILFLFTTTNLRLLRRESAAAGEPGEGLTTHLWLRSQVRSLLPDFWRTYGGRGDATAFPGLQFFVLALMAYACVLLGLALTSALPWLFPVTLVVTAAMAAHVGGAVFTEIRAKGRWFDLALLPATDAELTRALLLPTRYLWIAPVIVGLLALGLTALLSPVPTAAGVVWMLVNVLVLPPAAWVIGALLGVRSPSVPEVHWRTFVLFTATPVALLTAAAFQLDVSWAAPVCPPAVALSVVTSGLVSPLAWLGPGLYALAASLAAWGLCHRLRQWAVPVGS